MNLFMVFAALSTEHSISNDITDKLLPTLDNENEVVRILSYWAIKTLDFFGLKHNPDIAIAIYSVMVLVIAIGIGIAFRWIVLSLSRLLLKKFHKRFIVMLTASKFLVRITALIPPLAYLVFLHLTYLEDASLTRLLSNLTLICIIYVCVRSVNSFIDVGWNYFDQRQNKRKLPLKSLAQLATGIVWFIGVIITIAILVNKSPAKLLAGLGAFAAVLMLVFKDSILGVVAGVQLSEEDALHVGDWIKVPGTEANGSVIEANLVSVKVLNWDNTTTMLPPYSLISGSFTNYHSMQESNTRRIYRSYYLDADSIRALSEEELDRYRDIPFMDKWITAKLRQKHEGKECNAGNPEGLVDGSIETNLGLFRAYMKMYLDANQDISHTSTTFVSTDQQTAAGIPFYVWCFTNTSVWTIYEAIQAALFEHIAIMLTKFDLCVFENLSGRDTIAEGYACTGQPISGIFGAPEPFLYNEIAGVRSTPLEVNSDAQQFKAPATSQQAPMPGNNADRTSPTDAK